jgi:hypothetical protein
MTGSPFRRLEELAVVLRVGPRCSRATKEANLRAACQSAMDQTSMTVQ